MDGDAAELNERGRAVLVLQPLGGGAGVLTPTGRVHRHGRPDAPLLGARPSPRHRS